MQQIYNYNEMSLTFMHISKYLSIDLTSKQINQCDYCKPIFGGVIFAFSISFLTIDIRYQTEKSMCQWTVVFHPQYILCQKIYNLDCNITKDLQMVSSFTLSHCKGYSLSFQTHLSHIIPLSEFKVMLILVKIGTVVHLKGTLMHF